MTEATAVVAVASETPAPAPVVAGLVASAASSSTATAAGVATDSGNGGGGGAERRSRFRRICVYCGSAKGNKPSYHQDAAIQLGNQLPASPTVCRKSERARHHGAHEVTLYVLFPGKPTATAMRWYANVKEVGSGDTTVVLAHGYGANQTLWDKLLPALSEHHRVILFDWDFTGAGDEEEAGRYMFGRFADDLIALMDDKGVRGAVVVGHSMSAMAACIASVWRPDLFAHLVLLCASPRYLNSPSEGYVGGFDRASIDDMLEAMSSDFGAWVKGFVPNAAGGDPSASLALEQSFLSMHPGVALEVARMIFLGDQRGALDAVAAPCTVVQVAADFAAAPIVAEYMRQRMTSAPEVEVVVIDSVGHFPQLVAPQQLLAVLQRVLQRAGEVVLGASAAEEVEDEQAGEAAKVVDAEGAMA